MTKHRDAMHFVSLQPQGLPKRSHQVVRFTRPAEPEMMHVKIGHQPGVRHRLMVDRSSPYRLPKKTSTIVDASTTNGRTACDVTLADKFYAEIDEGYDGVLCEDGCFTKAELRVAAELAALAEQRRVDEHAREEAEREKWFAEADRKRTERMRALTPPPIPDDD